MKKTHQPPEPCATAELEEAIKVLEGRWKILIIFHLFSAPVLRFSELRRAMVGISQKMLIQQLRDLEKHGVVARKVVPGGATQSGVQADKRRDRSPSSSEGA